MTTLEKVKFIEKNAGLLPKVPDDYLMYFNQLKEGTDDFRDLDSDVLEIVKDGADKLYTKMAGLAEKTNSPFKLRDVAKGSQRTFIATIPNKGKTKDKIAPKFKVGDNLMHQGSTPYKVKITKVTWVESRATYMYSYTTESGVGSDDEKKFKKIPVRKKPNASTKATPKQEPTATTPKPEPPTFTGTMVRKETEEHRVVRRFLGNRKHPEINLIISAYKELVKSILEGKLKKEGAKNPELIYAIQKSYLNVIEKKANSLELSANLLDDAHKVFDSERRYDTVKYLSEYTGWTGKEKTKEQIKLFVSKVGNSLKKGKQSDPYFAELTQIYERLKVSKVGDIVMPTQVGLSGIPKGFRIIK